jgi:protocatechuate 3,4-dioxygenase beta subunit
MRWKQGAGWLTALTVSLQVVSPLDARAEEAVAPVKTSAAPQKPTIRDVALDADGALVGQVLSPEGLPLSDTRVALAQLNQVVGETTTDKQGKFAIKGLRGGTYEVRSQQASAAVRLWTADTAPPAASKGALLVSQRTTLRGNINYLNSQMMLAPEAVGAVMIPATIAGGAIILKQHHEQDSGS